MGKVVRYTGSKTLGEELRRLRGVRTLKDIVKMSRSSPLASRIHPLSTATLSQIENGVTMPSADVLYALSVVYGVSAARLLQHAVEERLGTLDGAAPTREETIERLFAAQKARRWTEAMALAIHGEGLAKNASDRVLWRANRALVLLALGMKSDAVSLVLECAESPSVAVEHRYIVQFYAVDILMRSGLLQTAEAHVRRTWELLPEPTPTSTLVRALRSRVWVHVELHAAGIAVDEATLRQCHRDIEEWVRIEPSPTAQMSFIRDRWHARVTEALGNPLVAKRDLARLAARAAAMGDQAGEAGAEAAIGALLVRAGKLKEAFKHFERAESRAVLSDDADTTFEVYFWLHSIAKDVAPDREEYFFKRCLRYLPQVLSRSPEVVAFEERLRDESRAAARESARNAEEGAQA